MFCQQCGTQHAEGAAFCSNCGTPLAASAAAPTYCQQCGTPGVAGQQFCQQCGAPLAVSGTAPGAVTPPSVQPSALPEVPRPAHVGRTIVMFVVALPVAFVLSVFLERAVFGRIFFELAFSLRPIIGSENAFLVYRYGIPVAIAAIMVWIVRRFVR